VKLQASQIVARVLPLDLSVVSFADFLITNPSSIVYLALVLLRSTPTKPVAALRACVHPAYDASPLDGTSILYILLSDWDWIMVPDVKIVAKPSMI
jgi:hypothetical protein